MEVEVVFPQVCGAFYQVGHYKAVLVILEMLHEHMHVYVSVWMSMEPGVFCSLTFKKEISSQANVLDIDLEKGTVLVTFDKK